MSEDRSTGRKIEEAIREACQGLVDRDVLVELVVLAAVAEEHLLVVGPPGTAKSQAVRRIATGLGGRYFEYLVGSFTEPSELFGPVSLKKLRDGVVETETAGMLPEAEIAFLDEVFLGSTAILNTLLGLLNERTFRRGHTAMRVPLRVCVGASNRLPDDPQLLAFADRFLLRIFVEPIDDSGLEMLLRAARSESAMAGGRQMEALDALTQRARAMSLEAVQPAIAQAIRVLRAGGITLSDRRVVRAQGLVAAAAALAGREAPTDADLWPLVYVLPTPDAQARGRELLAPLLERAENGALGEAALDASRGPFARAQKLVREAEALLAAPADGEARAGWLLRLEGVARDIDAGFAPEGRTPELAAVRTRITAELAPA